MFYFVSQKSNVSGDGTKERPFRTIGEAANLAMPGDTVVIGGGIYREWVKPQNGGLGNNQRITYIAAEKEEPIISGAEIIAGWTPFKKGVWRAEVSNELFGEYNPYADEIFGDWYDGLGQVHHTGELFLNGEAMYEAASLSALMEKAEKEEKKLHWFSEVEETRTVFYGAFGGEDPNGCCTEISVRPYCFFPEKEGTDFITVSGLTMCQAATQWAPPTAFQPGMIGPHWSKGWIIEKCRIHDSKCCGISLGKKRDLKDNCWTKDPIKGGAQTYTEIVFSNLRDGWDKEKIGSHIVRDNEIYNCGQAGIVGNMGGAFSDIVRNHIHHINIRGEFSGAEMAGIKLHAAIDTNIENNVIHDCNRGLWLDWEAQGTTVRKNAFFRNDEEEDLFIEVCHGPCIVENNLLLSTRSFLDVSQGTACVHNLFAGKIYAVPDTNRFTMYHLPHSTMVGGVMLVYGGDDRILNNIFIGQSIENKHRGVHGTKAYENYSHSAAPKTMDNDTPAADIGRTLPMTIQNNVYLNKAENWTHEKNPRVLEGFDAKVSIVEEDGHIWLYTNLGEIMENQFADRITTDTLGKAFEPDQAYENRDGSPVSIDFDFNGTPRGETVKIGPFEKYCDKILLL